MRCARRSSRPAPTRPRTRSRRSRRLPPRGATYVTVRRAGSGGPPRTTFASGSCSPVKRRQCLPTAAPWRADSTTPPSSGAGSPHRAATIAAIRATPSRRSWPRRWRSPRSSKISGSPATSRWDIASVSYQRSRGPGPGPPPPRSSLPPHAERRWPRRTRSQARWRGSAPMRPARPPSSRAPRP